jgi:hypothetical protein
MKQKRIWMAIVTEESEVVFCKPCRDQQKAEKAIVDYFRRNRKFKGKNVDDICFWIREEGLPMDLIIFPMQPEEFTDVRLPLSITPPPNEKGLFRVVYVLDVGAGNITEAALNAYEMMSDSDSLPPVLEVIDNKGNKIKIDLSERKESSWKNSQK